jgi:thiol-disulfide isomerase/thioredoxin
MDWSQYRTSHVSQYGPTTRQQLSNDYQKYKRSLTSTTTLPGRVTKPSSPKKSVRTSPVKQTIKSPMKSPMIKSVKSVKSIEVVPKSILRSPEKSRYIKNVKFDEKLEDVSRGRSPIRKNKKLTMKDIETMAAKQKFLIVVLYADFCGHCVEMKEKLGKKMKNSEKLMFVEEHDMSDEIKDYFPHVLYYENGERQKDLNVDNVYDYLNV